VKTQFNTNNSATQSMTSCSATLTSQQRRVLQLLLVKEVQMEEQCNKHMARFTNMLNELQWVNHHNDSDEHALKCHEFVRVNASIDCDMTVHEMVPGAIQIAMACDCVCIQAACFRIFYKWQPKLDNLRMKLLKIKTMCSGAMTHLPPTNDGVETCAKIEQIVRKMLKPTPP
jgi:hypothetical protein